MCPRRLSRHAAALAAVAVVAVLAPRAAGPGPLASALVGSPYRLSTPSVAGAAVRPARAVAQSHRIRATPGDTLDSLAAVYHSDAAAIRWANGMLDWSEPVEGTLLLLPPGPGAVVPLHMAELPSAFAQRTGVSLETLLDYNAIGSDAPRAAGTVLQLPSGAAPPGSLPSDAVVPRSPGVPGVDPRQLQQTADGRFPGGQCTWWVSQHRLVPWNGDAGSWFANARAYARPEGRVPVQGAIMVAATPWVGHVAYVDHVNPDGSFVITEMNVHGIGVLDERTVTLGSIPLIGFIY